MLLFIFLTLVFAAVYTDLQLKLIWFYQDHGLIDQKYLFRGDGFEYTYTESARMWAVILLLLLTVGWNIWYYRTHGDFIWNHL